jgi:hypothetical protein
MGLPYIALASAAGSLARLPRSGEWLRWMNRLFGVLLARDGALLRVAVARCRDRAFRRPALRSRGWRVSRISRALGSRSPRFHGDATTRRRGGARSSPPGSRSRRAKRRRERRASAFAGSH